MMDAANSVADICDINAEVVRRNVLAAVGRLSNQFFSADDSDEAAGGNGSDTESDDLVGVCVGRRQGWRKWLLYGREDLQAQCRAWVKENSSRKGTPNLKVRNLFNSVLT